MGVSECAEILCSLHLRKAPSVPLHLEYPSSFDSGPLSGVGLGPLHGKGNGRGLTEGFPDTGRVYLRS